MAKEGLDYGQGRFFMSHALLSAQAATTAGTWQSLLGLHPFTVTVSGTFSGTCKILVSDQLQKPADSETTHPQLGADITTPTLVSFAAPVQWIKVQVSSYASGSINAAVMACAPGYGPRG